MLLTKKAMIERGRAIFNSSTVQFWGVFLPSIFFGILYKFIKNNVKLVHSKYCNGCSEGFEAQHKLLAVKFQIGEWWEGVSVRYQVAVQH